MPVCDEETADAVFVLDEIAHVRDDQIDAVHIVAGESHAAVDNDDLTAVFIHGHVLSNFVKPSERDDF